MKERGPISQPALRPLRSPFPKRLFCSLRCASHRQDVISLNILANPAKVGLCVSLSQVMGARPRQVAVQRQGW